MKINSIKDYSRSIGFVSQNVFIFDEKLSYNITLDNEEIKNSFVDKYKKTKLLNWIKNSGMTFDSELGEAGGKISGGQKQRIGIARALYKSPEILILDEPTASLDIQSENEVFEILNELKNQITIVLVSHKSDNFKHCDRIIKLS